MSSPQKRQANRLNAQRSTGPRSVRGKRSSSLNALRHGLSVPDDQLVQPQIVTRLQQLIEEEGIDCFMLTETWLTQCSDACITECCPSGVSLLHTDRKGKSGGGVGIITRDSFGLTMLLYRCLLLCIDPRRLTQQVSY